MLKTINYSDPKRRPLVATRRTMISIEASRFQGSGCSECAMGVPSVRVTHRRLTLGNDGDVQGPAR
jgi:hypothetical protein